MTYNELLELKAERDHRKNRYYLALRNYGMSYDRYEEQHPEETHERLERVYQRYVEAKEEYETALNEYYAKSHLMTEYTSL